MGCGQGVQPILGNTPSSRAVNIRSVQRIGSAYPAERDTPLRLSSPLRHSCRFSFPRSVRHGFHLPALPSLHVHYRRFLATMGALTPALEFPALRLPSSMNTGLALGAGLPASRARPFRPFRLQPPNVPCRRFRTLPLSATGLPPPSGRVQVSPSASRLTATSGRIEFASATDWSFTSPGFGPHLAVTP